MVPSRPSLCHPVPDNWVAKSVANLRDLSLNLSGGVGDHCGDHRPAIIPSSRWIVISSLPVPATSLKPCPGRQAGASFILQSEAPHLLNNGAGVRRFCDRDHMPPSKSFGINRPTNMGVVMQKLFVSYALVFALVTGATATVVATALQSQLAVADTAH